MSHASGRSQAEDRLGETAAIFMINRRRKAMYGGLFGKLKYCPYPASSLLGSSTMAWRSLADNYVDMLNLPGWRSMLGWQAGWSIDVSIVVHGPRVPSLNLLLSLVWLSIEGR
jgi:hypothetical protein